MDFLTLRASPIPPRIFLQQAWNSRSSPQRNEFFDNQHWIRQILRWCNPYMYGRWELYTLVLAYIMRCNNGGSTSKCNSLRTWPLAWWPGLWKQSLSMFSTISKDGRSTIYRAPFQTRILVFESLHRLLNPTWHTKSSCFRSWPGSTSPLEHELILTLSCLKLPWKFCRLRPPGFTYSKYSFRYSYYCRYVHPHHYRYCTAALVTYSLDFVGRPVWGICFNGFRVNSPTLSKCLRWIQLSTFLATCEHLGQCFRNIAAEYRCRMSLQEISQVTNV